MQEDEGLLFGKKLRSYTTQIERSMKKSLEVFKGNNEKNTLSRKGPLSYQNRPQCGGPYYYTEKSSNRDQNNNVGFQNNASASIRKFQHADSASEGLSENNKTLRNPNSRSMCIQAVSQTSPLYRIEARSKLFCNRCNTAGLEQNV